MTSNPAVTVYGIPNCTTVKKARQWLDERNITYHFHDFKQRGVPGECLAAWLDAIGWQALLNRRGSTWRALDAAVQANVQDAASAAALMRQYPSIIKRPLVQWPQGRITVGFDVAGWSAILPIA